MSVSEQQPSARSGSRFRRSSSLSCVAASRRRACRPGSSSPTGRRACSRRRPQALARYWTTEYDWRKCEARLNALPQFTTEIDGVDIHFIHVRSRHENALPLIMTHGWPGSVSSCSNRRPADRPDRSRRHPRGRIPPGAAVPARLRVLRRAGRAGLGRRPHRARVGGADGPPRLHALRRPGRRRRCPRHGPDGPPGGRGSGRLH